MDPGSARKVARGMPGQVRYVHTNLVARDWRRLAQFYIEEFGCTLVPPERDYRGPDLDAGCGLESAHLTGVHLRLPGWGEDGPTLEVYSYDEPVDGATKAVNRLGYGHLAFEVDDVHAVRERLLARGCEAVGEVVTLTTSTGSRVTWCYITDPEGNAVELQSWDR